MRTFVLHPYAAALSGNHNNRNGGQATGKHIVKAFSRFGNEIYSVFSCFTCEVLLQVGQRGGDSLSAGALLFAFAISQRHSSLGPQVHHSLTVIVEFDAQSAEGKSEEEEAEEWVTS